MKTKYLLKGLLRKIPGADYILYNVIHRSAGGGETQNARYCYSVWMRHLIQGWKKGMTAIPEKVVEFGPGRTLGVGILALVSGAEQYYGLDSIKFSTAADNISIFDELVDLLRQQAPIPDDNEFPNLKPKLESYDFPTHIFTTEVLRFALDERRLAGIKESLKAIDESPRADSSIVYIAPWFNTCLITPNSVGLILSQSVLQYMIDLDKIYRLMHEWLKPGGIISHQIDLKSLGVAETWYGHWEYSDLEWKIVKGRKWYSINRAALSTHFSLLGKYNFKVVNLIKGTSPDKAQRNKLADKFKNLTDEDIATSNLFVQAVNKK